MTVVYGVNAIGNALPPMFIFPRVKYHDHFIRDAPTSSIGGANKTGWMNKELFVDYLKHVIKFSGCSTEKKLLLILDNHETHKSLEAIDLARENGIIMLTLPPHTSHKL